MQTGSAVPAVGETDAHGGSGAARVAPAGGWPRRRTRPRRLLHPGAWWLWAGASAAAALRTTNPLLLALIIAATAFVVASRRPVAPWARSFGGFFRLAVIVVAIRVLMQMWFGARLGDHVLFSLPTAELPTWAAGVSLGGPVSVELLLASLYSSLQLATVLICFGAVNSLCSPYRLLRSLPAVLYEAGVVVTVALSFAPQTVMAVARVRDARRLRGHRSRGLRSLRGLAMPVLESALERSVALAASMDSRGYGRRGDMSVRSRRVVTGATALGLLLVLVGVYALLDVSAPRALSLPVLAVGSAALAVGLFSKGRHSQRTRYRADPWRAPEWLVSASGVAAVALMVVAGRVDPSSLTSSVIPLAWPALSGAAVAGAACVALPAWLAPPVPVPVLVEPAGPDAPRPGTVTATTAPLVASTGGAAARSGSAVA